jgi:predicted esterase
VSIQVEAPHEEGRLTARPSTVSEPLHQRGVTTLPHRASLYVPPGVDPAEPTPLLVMLHGAGGNARGALALIDHAALRQGVAVLAIDSAHSTWDVVRGGFGPDVRALDRALSETFRRVAVDPDRIGIGGFSDGASYALSVGLTNGDLFRYVLAFSPGFSAPGRAHGRPRVFVSHGTEDRVLPIERTSHRLVRRLEREGYAVRYEELEGEGHAVPRAIAEQAVGILARGG